MDILGDAKKMQEKINAHRQYLHKIPELGLDLPNTKAYVVAQLKEMGYEPQEICKNTITAVVGAGKGKTFLLRADMDGLPIREETGLPYASENGNMHACGHDCHAAMLLGAAELLKKYEDQIPGTIKLLFQPGEETMEGAKQAVEAGVTDGVDAAMMCHIVSGMDGCPDRTCLVFGKGVCYASSDWFRIDVNGKGGHGAMPNDTIHPITILNSIYTALQQIMAEEISPAENAVMTIGEIHSGNVANVIPDTAYMAGTIRTLNEEVRKSIKEKLVTQAEAIAAMKGGQAKVVFNSSTPCVVCDENVAKSVFEGITESIGKDAAVSVNLSASASEDFAYIAEKVPSSVIFFVAGIPADGYCYPCHHPKAAFDGEALYLGAAAYASAAIKWLSDNQ